MRKICWIVTTVSLLAVCVFGFCACDPNTYNRDGVEFLAWVSGAVCFAAFITICIQCTEGEW